jgi:hypothetical protein
MAKNIHEPSRAKKNVAEREIIPQKYQHPLAIGIIYVSILIFFYAMVFEGKVYQEADSLPVWDSFSKQVQHEGSLPLWNPYLFCGMPGYASLSYPIAQAFDLTTILWEKVGRTALSFLFFKEGSSGANLVFYLTYGIGMYLLAYRFLRRKPIAVLVALMALYATYIALFIMIGHLTKLAVLSWFPYVFLIVDKLREKFNLLLACLLPIVVRVMLQSAHVQVLFYIFLSLGLYLMFFLIRALIKKEVWKNIALTVGVLLVAVGLAFLMGATQHFSTYEYNPFSIRGSNPIQTAASASPSKTIEGGLDYDYATNYSFSPGELMTFFVPSWYGFGPLPYQGPLTQNQLTKLYLYWGQQPRVDGPQYMGIIAIVFALIGLYRMRKEPIVQFLGGIIGFSLLVSFGKEFSPVYDLMYNFVPVFNKFRAPSMILIMVQFFTPILAGFGILSFMPENRNAIDPARAKQWKYIFGILAGLLVIVFIGKDVVKDVYQSFFPLQDVAKNLSHSYGNIPAEAVSMMFDFVFASVVTDIIVAVISLGIAFGAFYYYQKGKIQSSMVYGVLVVVVLFDLWRVASKPHDPITPQEAKQVAATPNYVHVLQQDTTQYRVLQMDNGQPAFGNAPAYWLLHNAYGYHAAKLRIYQDMVDVAGLGNPLVWQLMNIKYLISNREDSSAMLTKVYHDGQTNVYAFRYWLPHAFLVNGCDVADGMTTLNKIAALSFDPRQIAYVPEHLSTVLDAPKEGANATVTSYRTQELEVRVHATGNNLLFISDAYYPKGWKAYVDGKETEILRLDYLFRGVVVPQGTHTVTMKFEPTMFYLGKEVSLWVSLVVYGMLTVLGVMYWKKKR